MRRLVVPAVSRPWQHAWLGLIGVSCECSITLNGYKFDLAPALITFRSTHR
jgi:hypothetical protein